MQLEVPGGYLCPRWYTIAFQMDLIKLVHRHESLINDMGLKVQYKDLVLELKAKENEVAQLCLSNRGASKDMCDAKEEIKEMKASMDELKRLAYHYNGKFARRRVLRRLERARRRPMQHGTVFRPERPPAAVSPRAYLRRASGVLQALPGSLHAT